MCFFSFFDYYAFARSFSCIRLLASNYKYVGTLPVRANNSNHSNGFMSVRRGDRLLSGSYHTPYGRYSTVEPCVPKRRRRGAIQQQAWHQDMLLGLQGF